jgi:hypothetical protein
MANVVKGKRRNCANRDVPVVVLALQDYGLCVLTPLSFPRIMEPANGETTHPPLPHVIVHLSRAHLGSTVIFESLSDYGEMHFLIPLSVLTLVLIK